MLNTDDKKQKKLKDDITTLQTDLESISFNEERGLKLSFIKDLIEAGVAIGRKRANSHPKAKPYIAAVKNGICIIDIKKIESAILQTIDFLVNLLKNKDLILVVGTKINHTEIIKKFAETFNCPYVILRWLGGTLTNFKTISAQLKYFIDFEKKFMAGEFNKYTKSERVKMAKELEKLRIKFGGLKNLTKMPAAIFISDLVHETTALREAKKVGIKVVALGNTNANPHLADYFIMANTDSRKSVEFLINYLIEEIKKKL